ncbi:MAG: protein transport protein SEC61 subunit gamma-like protein [Methanobacteriota archaeon]|jgi:protein transport protein SEC61 subunit gamma-like protein|uniref:Protein translocase SEC61 complex subunit gamma n=1 Tax=Halorutilus salinus TaxID=2487751 RepID=A0A9Q4C3M3_9EURY|nr:protein translocase SEC61 complex subunit gamma [Halorutilus salinus]MCX2818492.1 protein translocase SEC61 complex subunit gamma [Halorutilus salinus]
MGKYFSLNVNDYLRVLKLARTPTWDEFKQVAMIAGAGVLLVGIVGFLIYIGMRPLPP